MAAALILNVVSCGKQRSNGNVPAPPSDKHVFEVKGVVQEVMADRKKVRIDHEAISNYMEAMIMDFDVKDVKELDGIAPGDQVAFRMVVTEKDGWIENVKKTGRKLPTSAGPESFVRIRDVEPLNPGDQIPDYKFTNQLGQAIKFSDFKGNALAFTFIFTRCPFPTFCPRMSSHFSEALAKLKETPNAPTNWHFLTISFDPDFDTPRVLAGYAKTQKADTNRWTFATSDLTEIGTLASQVGLVFYRPEANNPASINHNLRTVVIDAQGKLQKVFTDNEWKPEQLVEEMIKAAGVTTPIAANP